MGVHNGVRPWMVMDGHGNCVTSMDTVTEGYAQWCSSMDYHGWSRQWWDEP